MTTTSRPVRVGHQADESAEGSANTDRAVPRQWTITIPSPGWWITANTLPSHPMARHRLVKPWREVAHSSACAVRPKLPTGLPLVRVDVHFRWAKAPVRDLRNMEPTIKAAIDGIGPARGSAVGYGLVKDDSDKHLVYGPVTSEIAIFPRGKVKLDPYYGEVVLTVTEMGGTPC